MNLKKVARDILHSFHNDGYDEARAVVSIRSDNISLILKSCSIRVDQEWLKEFGVDVFIRSSKNFADNPVSGSWIFSKFEGNPVLNADIGDGIICKRSKPKSEP